MMVRRTSGENTHNTHSQKYIFLFHSEDVASFGFVFDFDPHGFWLLPGVHTEGSVFHQVQYVINVVVHSEKKKRAGGLMGGGITQAGWMRRDEEGKVKAAAAVCKGPTCC